MKKLEISKSFSPEIGTEIYKLNIIPDNYLWCFGSVLNIITNDNKNYFFIYIADNEIGQVFYNKEDGQIYYLDEILEIKNCKEITVKIPCVEEIINGYLKGLTIYTLSLTEEIELHKKEINFYKKTIQFLIELQKNFEEN